MDGRESQVDSCHSLISFSHLSKIAGRGTRTNRIEEIFQDARELQADALEMLAQGRIRNAAVKSWGATKRATDALILARTGEEPERTPETEAALQMLSSLDEGIR